MGAGGRQEGLGKSGVMCDGGYELVRSRGACVAGSTDVEGSHCPSNPVLDRKMWMLNENDDDDDDDDDDDSKRSLQITICYCLLHHV